MRKLLDEILHFGIIGVINTIMGLVLNMVFYNILHWNFWVATAVSYTLGSIFSYFANKKLTFKVEESNWKTALRFAGHVLVCYLLAYGIAKPAVKCVMAGYAPMLSAKTGIEAKAIEENVAILFGTGLFIIFNFIGQKFFVFSERGNMRFDIKDEGGRKVLFAGLVFVSFLLILIYNAFTPMMTDDLTYAERVAGADSFWDLIRQEKYQYMTWTGRSVNHMILRLFLLGDKWIFNLCNSVAFVALSLFMYYNVERRKAYDVLVYLFIQLFLWVFAVCFEQTVLWQTGACNYLWGSTVIMAYISAFRHCLKADCGGEPFSPAGNERVFPVGNRVFAGIGLFLLGILAGWCNENTSGGCILLTGIWVGFYVWKKKRVRAWMVSGMAGSVTGFLFMVLAPGNANRAQYMEEEHTGLFAIVSRWQKCNLAIREHFFILIAIAVAAFILVRLQKAKWEKSGNMLLYFFVFVATCYALVLVPEPMGRAYFGAGIFLTVSCVQGIVDISDADLYLRALKLCAVSILALYFLFDYMECGAHLVRIYRESEERFRYIEEQKAAGSMDITVPLLRPGFQNKYSDAYNSDLSGEDSGYWVNVAYAAYFQVDSISAVPRDEWEEY